MKLSLGEVRYLDEFQDAEDDALCKAVWGAAILYQLGFDDEQVRSGWRKLAGRRVRDVHAFVREARGQRLERRQLTLTTFAKNHPVAA